MNRLLPLALLVATGAARADVHRFALVVGDSQGGAGTRQLRYAERDARRIHAILTRLGGVREDDARQDETDPQAPCARPARPASARIPPGRPGH